MSFFLNFSTSINKLCKYKVIWPGWMGVVLPDKKKRKKKTVGWQQTKQVLPGFETWCHHLWIHSWPWSQIKKTASAKKIWSQIDSVLMQFIGGSQMSDPVLRPNLWLSVLLTQTGYSSSPPCTCPQTVPGVTCFDANRQFS